MRRTFLLLFLLCAHVLFPSLPPETLIQTPDGLVQIQNLKSGGHVLGFDLKTNQYLATNIISISRVIVKKSVKVTTDSDVFEISDDQLVRVERTGKNHERLFIPAWFLAPGDLLQSNNLSQKCVRVEQINNCEKPFYELHLASPHHFFATEQHILMHNVVEGTAVVFMSTGATESGLGSIISKASEAIAGPVVGLLVLFGTAVSILYNMKDAPEPAPTLEVKKPEPQAPAPQNKILDLSSKALVDKYVKEQQQLKQQQRSSTTQPAEPTRTPIIAEEKDDATQDRIDSEIMRKKIASIDLISRKILEDELLKGERSSSPDDWFKPGGPGASPPHTNPADSLTFKDWTFLPQAFFGMSAYSLAPRLAVAAIESALCMAGATVAMPTAVFMAPFAACAVAEYGGICMLVDSARRMVLTVLKIAARVKNLLKARTDIKTFEYTIPKSISKSLEADAESETVSELSDAKAETTTRTATGGPEPPEDPDDEEDIPEEDVEKVEDKEALDGIEKLIEKGSHDGTQPHILNGKHFWDKLVENYKENWPKVRRIIARTIKKGRINKSRSNKSKGFITYELKIRGNIIEARTFIKPDGSISVTTAMIQW